MAKTHGVSASTAVSMETAEQVARLMSCLSTPSRVRILAHLREGQCAVGDLAEVLAMSQPAVSQQLRVLRDLGLVVGTREGRRTMYSVHDPHVAALLEEGLRHIEHLGDHPSSILADLGPDHTEKEARS